MQSVSNNLDSLMIYKNISTSNWDEWVEFCQHYGEDPHEISELGFDKGGGDSQTVRYTGDYPKKEENHA